MTPAPLRPRLFKLHDMWLPRAVVHLACQISFSGQDKDMPKEELNLFQFTATHVTELGASSPVMRSKMIQLHPFGTPPNHVPDDILDEKAISDRCSLLSIEVPCEILEASVDGDRSPRASAPSIMANAMRSL